VAKAATKTFYGNNPESANPFTMIDSEHLKAIKEEVFSKVREELELETKRSLLKSKQFEELINMEVRNTMNDMLEKQRKELAEAAWEVTPLSFGEEEISSYLAYVYKFIPVNLLELQRSQRELGSLIADLEYCYFLKLHSSTTEIAHVLAKVNRQIKGYKSIEILLVAFKQASFLEKIMLRTIEFIWKYEYAKEVVFFYSYSTPDNQAYVKMLKENLSTYCAVVERKGRTLNEAKFIFIKKGNN
jgi:hypothetical protein